MKPLCIDLFCGLGGWAEGFLSEGWDVIGFDIERHDYGTGGYPGQLVLQDVTTLHGSQFRNADMIVASPPCQKYSYMAMPWSRAKTEAAWQRWFRDSRSPFADPFTLNDLFNACFRIQREASEAAGRPIPLIVENVKGAQPWVGRAAWHYGSYFLWGDIPALMPSTLKLKRPGRNFHAHENGLGSSPSFNGAQHEIRGVRSDGAKQHGSGPAWFDKALDERRKAAGRKVDTDNEGPSYGGDFGWDKTALRRGNSKSNARKAASAQIAKIPFELSSWIARIFKPHSSQPVETTPQNPSPQTPGQNQPL